MKYIVISVFIICMMSMLIFPCYGRDSRKDIISFNLDYYELKKEVSEEIIKRDAEEKEKEEEEARRLTEKIEQSKIEWTRKRKIVTSFLDDLKFKLIFQETYNDNIYKTNNNTEADLVTKVSLGLSYVPKVSLYRKRKLDVFFDLTGGALGYASNSDSNTGDFAIRTGLNYTMTRKYGLFIDYTFKKLQATASEVTSGGSRTRFVDYWQNIAGIKFEAAWGKFPWEIKYAREAPEYESGFESSEYITNRISILGRVKAFPKTSFLWAYDYGEVEYPARVGNDYNFYKIWGGVSGKLSAKIKGIIRLGFGEYQYDTSSTDTEEAQIKLDYTFSKRLFFQLAAKKSLEATTFDTDNSSDKLRYSLICRYLPPFNKNIIFRFSSAYISDDYESGRDDETLRYTFSTSYGIKKWGVLSLKYEHDERDSNEQEENYKQNIVSLSAKVTF